jgi:hypothetical protein
VLFHRCLCHQCYSVTPGGFLQPSSHSFLNNGSGPPALLVLLTVGLSSVRSGRLFSSEICPASPFVVRIKAVFGHRSCCCCCECPFRPANAPFGSFICAKSNQKLEQHSSPRCPFCSFIWPKSNQKLEQHSSPRCPFCFFIWPKSNQKLEQTSSPSSSFYCGL